MDADVRTMYIHILAVISTGSRVFSGTISHALVHQLYCGHDRTRFLDPNTYTVSENNSSRQISFGFDHTYYYPSAVDHTIAINCIYVASGIHLLEPMLSNRGSHHPQTVIYCLLAYTYTLLLTSSPYLSGQHNYTCS